MITLDANGEEAAPAERPLVGHWKRVTSASDNAVRARAMRESGKTHAEIAHQLGVGVRQVHRYLNDEQYRQEAQ